MQNLMTDSPKNFSKLSVHTPTAVYEFAQRIEPFLNEAAASKRDIVFVCIGTDRSTGDALGPLTGSKLKQLNLRTPVYGTLEEPVHATNLAEYSKRIYDSNTNPFLIAIDACLGQMNNVGYLSIGKGSVLDTNFSADLTIMEEASELVKRITKQTKPLPQFTSCCPAWVKFAETFYPAILPHISTAKSPIGMQGPTIKTFFAKLNDLDSKKIINVAVTPCTAKKFEIRRPEMKAAADYLNTPELRDMDYVITTRELAQWLKEEKIDFAALDDADYDTFMGAASGAGVIFGNTGGVMEAAARTAYYFITGENPPADFMNLQPVRGMDGIREAKVTIADVPLRLAIVHGTENARQLIESWQKGETTYDFVEVMTCRCGCIGGGGQPKAMPMTDEIRTARINALYAKDSQMTLRLSHENPDIKKAYKEFYASPLSELAEALLHTDYIDRSSDLGEAGIIAATEQIAQDSATPRQSQTQYRCTICGYIHDGDLPDGFICPTCGVPKELFEAVAAPSTPSEKPVDIAPPPTKSTKQYRCTICGYIHDGDLPEDFTCPLCGVPKELFEEVN